jgi:NhaP-type Na+/H+ or K+/H+ antiporter
LLLVTLATGSVWVLLGRRLGDDGSLADRVAGAALIAFALLLVRPLMIQFTAT